MPSARLFSMAFIITFLVALLRPELPAFPCPETIQPSSHKATRQIHPGFYFLFKHKSHWMRHPMNLPEEKLRHNLLYSYEKLDTMSNWYSADRQYIEIIRQDHQLHPTLGMALGFNFHDSIQAFPYTASLARLQLKNFRWGGLEFSPADTFNYTGVTNEVSDDLTVEVDYYDGDSISGRFSGVLISGAGSMAELDSGTFAVKLYRLP